MSDFGTIAWGERSGGELNTADRLRYIAQGVALQLKATSMGARARLGIAPERLDGVELPERPPDSKLAREAEEHCRELSSPSLLNHCLRTWLWGELLARRDRLRYDEELFFVASLLHDLGLTDDFQGRPPSPPCFAVQGAVAARDWALAHDCERDRADRLANAISLHVNSRVTRREGIEEHLLAAGAAFDVIGSRRRELATPLVASALARHPRLGFKREMNERSRTAARRGPRTRVALGYRLGFERLIHAAPFED